MEARKRTYNKPMLQSEAFVPNQYVAACAYRVTVECNFAGDKGEGSSAYDNGHYHSACGIAVPINISDGGTGIEKTVTVDGTTYGGHAIYDMVVGGQVNCTTDKDNKDGATGSTNLNNLTIGNCYKATWKSRGSDDSTNNNYNTIYTHNGVATVTALGNFS